MTDMEMIFYVQYHITHGCNLKCSHCYQSSFSSDRELSLQEIFGSIREISEMVCDWRSKHCPSLQGVIHLTGGEPLVRSDWETIIDFCLDQSLKAVLMSNGTLVTNDIAERLADKQIEVQISLDGLKATHEEIRGPNSFENTLAGIRHLRKNKVPTSVSLTLMKRNLHELDDLIEVLKEHDVSYLGISRYIPAKHAKNDKQALSPQELKDFSKYLAKTNRSPDFRVVCRDPLVNLPENQIGHHDRTGLEGCTVGLCGFCVLADGTMIPCSRLNIPLGNVRTDSIREVWAKSEILDTFREFSNLKGKCGHCEHIDSCRGCRAIAHAINDDYLAEDPHCWL